MADQNKFTKELTKEQQDYFNEVSTKRELKSQAIFFLNAFWPELGEEKAELVWSFVLKFRELDKQFYNALPEPKKSERGEGEGKDLDEFWTHKALEHFGKPMSVVEFRAEFKKIDVNFDKKVSMVEFCLYWFDQGVKVLLERPQGTNEELDKAQKALDVANAEIQRIEKEKSRLEKLAEGTSVKANSAKAELAALLSAPTTELNKSLLTAEAAVRKARNNPSGDTPMGQSWWIERELTELKKYKPQKSKT